MAPKRPLPAWWVGLNIAVFLLWLHFAVRNAHIIANALTEPAAGQVILVLSLLLAGWAIYYAVIAVLAQGKAGRRLFHLEVKWKRFFVLAGLFLTANSVAAIFLSQVTMDPVSMIGGLAKIAAAFYAGMIGLVDTGVTEKGLATPFALVPWPDVEAYEWLDDRRIVFRARAWMAGFRYKMRPTFNIDPTQREPLNAFLLQRVSSQP